MGELNTQGTFDGIVDGSNNAANFDVTWNFSFTDSAGPCDASGSCHLKISEADPQAFGTICKPRNSALKIFQALEL